MLYRENPKNGDKLSQLGFGCMRLSSDKEKARSLVREAIDNGVNYFDTAYIYTGNEALLGYALEGGYREKVKIATKMPLFIMKKNDTFVQYFEKSLERLKTTWIDYFLMHMFVNYEQFLSFKERGFGKWAEEEKAKGRIKNFGFSFHGPGEDFKKIVDGYDWDFCMIQYNYIDENNQAGTAGLKHAHAKGLPVMIMEPLRGGKLATNLPKAAKDSLDASGIQRSPAEWGLRWVWNHPEVTLLLSGMNEKSQMDENLRIASEAAANALSEKELAAYEGAKSAIRAATKAACTGCGYCMPCPAGVNIPQCFSALNETGVSGQIGNKFQMTMRYAMSNGIVTKKPSYASQCKKCGKCEKHCPQNLKIMDLLDETKKTLEPFYLKGVARIARFFMRGNQ